MKIQQSRILYSCALLSSIFLASCDDDSSEPGIEAPATYFFERDNTSSVSFGGQTTRIMMGEEIISSLKDETKTKVELQAMYDHAEGAADFGDADLNASGKNTRSKTAASTDYFASNTVDATAIKEDFDGWIVDQVDDVFSNRDIAAAAGTAGQIADGSSTRYVNKSGIELNQVFGKSLIGALMTDQILNNYLSTAVLDASGNSEDNDGGVVADGKNYTTMEHKWDEAYGYAYGTAQDLANPNATIGSDDSFLNKYIGKVDADEDFTGIAADIFNAFKLGRAAIVAKDYTVRDAQAEIIRADISKVIAVRAVHYLQAGKAALNPNDMGPAFHDLSEGLGFVYSLQFTRVPGTNVPYFNRTDVMDMIDTIVSGQNGLWDVTAATLDDVSATIAGEFDFTVEQTL